MKKFGINSQWSKKDAVAEILPEDVIDQCKPILRLTEDEAGTHVYRDLKAEILKLYGPKDEDAYLKATALTRSDNPRPSALGKKILHLICPGAKPFESCHCAKIVYGMWVSKLSQTEKAAILSLKFDQTTYQQIFDLADKSWLSTGSSTTAVVAAVATPSSDASQAALDAAQVSAVSSRGNFRGRNNRGNRGNRGGRGTYRGGQNNSNQNQTNTRNNSGGQTSGQKPHQKGPRHQDGPPDSACSRHWSQGKGATYCSDPLVCGWASIIAPRPKNNNSNN